MTRRAFGNAERTIFRMESDKSRVTSSTAKRFSSLIHLSTPITSSDFVPATTATRDLSLVHASLLVTNVYSSPLESDDSSMAILGPMLSGKSKPIVCVFQLVPVAETAQHLLILLFKCMSVDVVEFLEAYGRSLGTSPYVSFKKAPNSLE